MTKSLKIILFRLVCLSSLTALVNVKMNEIANQIKEGFMVHSNRAEIQTQRFSFNN